MAVWSRIQSFIFGGAVATAAADAVRPELEVVRQHAWDSNQTKVLDPMVAADLAAQALVPLAEAVNEAARNGIGPNRVHALVKLLQTAPDLGALDHMLNRQTINRELFDYALAKHKVDPRYWNALFDLTNDKLSVADVAAAVQQGHLPNDGILPEIEPDIGTPAGYLTPEAPDGFAPSSVPLTTIGLDPIDEAAAQGYDLPRLRVRANLSGLPPGPHDLLQMWNRHEITEEAVDAGIREGHMKTKWAQAFKRMRWAVLSASEYANAYIRAWVTHDEMIRGGALTGHTPEQMELMYRNRGRPIAPVQAFTSWARGAPHPDIPGEPHRPGTFDEQDFNEAIRRADIQTWYAPVLWHNRFAYPSLFQLRGAVQSKAITPARALTILKYERYEDQDARALVNTWAQGSTAAAKDATKAELADEYAGGFITPQEYRRALEQLGFSGQELQLELELGDARRNKRYREKVIDAVHNAYVEFEIDDNEARSDLATVNVTGEAARMLVNLWQLERRYTRSRLTIANVVKAAGAGLISSADALTRLQQFGLSLADARVRLEEG